MNFLQLKYRKGVKNMNAEIENYSDNKRKREMIDGRIYLMATPCDEHKNVQDNITMIFNNYFKQNKRRCRAITESQLYHNEKNYFEPDVKVICRESAGPARQNDDIPVIVVEVLSKSTADRDTGIKMKKYASLGIKEYWIISWEMTTIDMYLLNDNNEYERYKFYAYYKTEKELKRLDENELKEVVKEFSPISFPKLIIQLEDVFDIFE